jgi:hypothetical protein
MSLQIFRIILILVLWLVLLLVLCLTSFMDLIITHMVLAHERTILYLDALVMAHILIVVIISYVGMVFLLEGLTLTLWPDTWAVHIFPLWFLSHWFKGGGAKDYSACLNYFVLSLKFWFTNPVLRANSLSIVMWS